MANKIGFNGLVYEETGSTKVGVAGGVFEETVAAAGGPTAVNDEYNVTEGTQKVVTAPGILDNDTYVCI